jgi:hypothetical protein
VNKRNILISAVGILMAFFVLSCKAQPELLSTEKSFVSDKVHQSFLPFLSNFTLEPGWNVGVESEVGWYTTSQFFNPNTQLKVSCNWSKVEAEWSVYDWSSCDIKVGPTPPTWMVFKMTPQWALEDGELECKLPKRIHWPNAAYYLQTFIDRYNPVYVEIWNEPNTPHSMMNLAHLFGCIGDGKLYSEFYTYLQRYTHGATLVAGALSSVDNQFTRDMMGEIGTTADAFSFHCYPWYVNGTFSTTHCQDRFNLATSMTDQPIFLSETAVQYKSGPMSGYEHAQIAHYEWLKTLPTYFFWYTIHYNGWPVCIPEPCNTDMITRNNTTGDLYPRPVWYNYIQENP